MFICSPFFTPNLIYLHCWTCLRHLVHKTWITLVKALGFVWHASNLMQYTLVSVSLRERILNSTTVLLYCTVVFYLIPNSIYWPPWWGMWEQISRVFHQSKQGCRLSCVGKEKSFFSFLVSLLLRSPFVLLSSCSS